ncbi:MAG: ribose 5-phosphate isomerase A [Nitrososphaerota archaeon]
MKEEVLRAREAAIREALKEIRDGMVIGYGSGTTVAQMTAILKELVREQELDLLFIPSSIQSTDLLISHGLRVASLNEYPEPDLMLDSFDQVDSEGNVIKGGGGALLREKVLMQASRRVILIGDHLKLKEKMDFPVPIEILQYAYPHAKRVLSSWGLRMEARISGGKMGPVITDNGNILADVHAGTIDDPENLDRILKSVAGILETGICPKAADQIIIGYPDGDIKRININRRRL